MIADLVVSGVKNIAIASAFSPMNADPEKYVAKKILKAIPDAKVTLSHNFGRLGLMERENAAILNTTLLPFAEKVISSFLKALTNRGLTCPVYISQNDGTLMSADFVSAYPALTFASGPTNSLRGAYKLTGLKDAIVVDIGGTTSDIGVLQGGFPRESNTVIEIGGVRTNFRMPDILAIGLGGGSVVSDDGRVIGPKSVGHRLVDEGLVFGGNTLTTTDIIVASGVADIGDSSKVAHLEQSVVENALARMHQMLDQNIEMMKPGGKAMPVILVGGGSVLVTGDLQAASKIHRPENAGVANAIGAAIAQIGGESERLMSYRDVPRDEAIAKVTQVATERAVNAGADLATIRTVDIEETTVPYMDESTTRVRVKVIGEIA
jgi:N-methylhydantoinase A/oxoprolinase/acetone carboxylase beta subunit